MRTLISPRTRMIIINSPHNPTGSLLDADDLAVLAELTRDTNIVVLSDEVYEHIVFDAARHVSVEMCIRDRCGKAQNAVRVRQGGLVDDVHGARVGRRPEGTGGYCIDLHGRHSNSRRSIPWADVGLGSQQGAALGFNVRHEALDQRFVEWRQLEKATTHMKKCFPRATFGGHDVTYLKRHSQHPRVTQVNPAILELLHRFESEGFDYLDSNPAN